MNEVTNGSSVVLLDYDGVIVDSIELFVETANVAAKELNREPTFSAETLKNLREMSIYSITDALGVDRGDTEMFLRALDDELMRRYREVTMFSEMREVIEDLSERALVGIVSATPSEVIAEVMAHCGLIDCFAHISGGELGKSKAERICSIVENHNASILNTWMIGDTVSDIEQGKLAGCRTVAVSWGWHRVSWLREAGPDCVVKKPKELVGCVTGGCG